MENKITNMMILGVVAIVAVFGLVLVLSQTNGYSTGAALKGAPTPIVTEQQALESSFPYFWCADTDGSGNNDVSDLTYFVNYMFKNGTPPVNDSGDVNADCNVNVADLTYLIDWMFKGGSIPMCNNNCTTTDPPQVNLSIYTAGNSVIAECYITQYDAGIFYKNLYLQDPSGQSTTSPTWNCGGGGGPGYSVSFCSAQISDVKSVGMWHSTCLATNTEGQQTTISKNLIVNAVCGNGVCESGETAQNCPADCGVPIQPDLVVLGAWYLSTNGSNQTNTTPKIVVSVKNIGTGPSTYFTVRSLLSSSPNITSNLYVPGLAAGQQMLLTHYLPSQIPYGVWQYSAYADSTYRIVESNEANNAYQTIMTIY